jgi:hypothetical protein
MRRKRQHIVLATATQFAAKPIVSKLSGYAQSVKGHGRQQVTFGFRGFGEHILPSMTGTRCQQLLLRARGAAPLDSTQLTAAICVENILKERCRAKRRHLDIGFVSPLVCTWILLNRAAMMIASPKLEPVALK